MATNWKVTATKNESIGNGRLKGEQVGATATLYDGNSARHPLFGMYVRMYKFATKTKIIYNG